MARKTREQAELEAYLRHKRAFEKKLDDIRWNFEEFQPLLERYKNGELKISKTLEIEGKDV